MQPNLRVRKSRLSAARKLSSLFVGFGLVALGLWSAPASAGPGAPPPGALPTPISEPTPTEKKVGLTAGVALLKSPETLKIGGWRAVWEFQGARSALESLLGPNRLTQIEVGGFNQKGCSQSVLVLANCRNLSPATVKALKRYMANGGKILATYQSSYRQADNSSWSPNGLALGKELGVKFSRWSGGNIECGRLLPVSKPLATSGGVELLRHQAMLVDPLPGSKVLAQWDRPENSPAIVQGPSGIYCGEDLLAPENSQSPAILEILANCIQGLDQRIAIKRPLQPPHPKAPSPPFAKLPALDDQQQIAVGMGNYDLQGGSLRIRAHQGGLQVYAVTPPSDGSRTKQRNLKGSYPEVWVRLVEGHLKLSVASPTGPSKELSLGESSFELAPKKSQDYLDLVWETAQQTSRWTAVRGKLEIRPPAAQSSRGLELVNELPLDAYIMGVVPSEVPASFPSECLKAMAVVARTFCLAHLDRHHADGYDVCAEVHCQVYRGLAQESIPTNLAVYSTLGEVLSYQGHPVDATFHACCGGYGVDVESIWPKGKAVAYLRGRPDSEGIFQSDLGNTRELKAWLQKPAEEAFCSKAGRYRWSETMTWLELERKLQQSLPVLLGAEFKGLKKLKKIEVEVRDVSGRVTQMLIEGDAGESYRLGGDSVRWTTSGGRIGSGGLNSCLFVLEVSGTGDSRKVVFQGAGWGHGVGLCQEGAAGRARAGQTYSEILSHYYRGTEILSQTKKSPEKP